MIMTASLDSIVTDSAPGMQNYVTGNKSANNQEGVWPDDRPTRSTTRASSTCRNTCIALGARHSASSRPRTFSTRRRLRMPCTRESRRRLWHRGPVPGRFQQDRPHRADGRRTQVVHARIRRPAAATPGCGEASGFNGSARSASSDYVLPGDLVAGWGVAPGAKDPSRDLIADFKAAGWSYAPDSGGSQ